MAFKKNLNLLRRTISRFSRARYPYYGATEAYYNLEGKFRAGGHGGKAVLRLRYSRRSVK